MSHKPKRPTDTRYREPPGTYARKAAKAASAAAKRANTLAARIDALADAGKTEQEIVEETGERLWRVRMFLAARRQRK